jgi:hypothetical protein
VTAPPSPAARAEGERRKLSSQALLEARRAVYVRRGRRALLSQLLAAGTATADDVRAAVELPPGLDPKLFGVVPGPLAEAGIIKPAGFAKTARPQAHGRPVLRWQLADRGAAVAWLAANPDLPEPEADAPAQRTLFGDP